MLKLKKHDRGTVWNDAYGKVKEKNILLTQILSLNEILNVNERKFRLTQTELSLMVYNFETFITIKSYIIL